MPVTPHTLPGEGGLPPLRMPRLESVSNEGLPAPLTVHKSSPPHEVFTVESGSDEEESASALEPCDGPSPSARYTQLYSQPSLLSSDGSGSRTVAPLSFPEALTDPVPRAVHAVSEASSSPLVVHDQSTSPPSAPTPPGICEGAPAREPDTTKTLLAERERCETSRTDCEAAMPRMKRSRSTSTTSSSNADDIAVSEPPPALSDEQKRAMSLVVDHARSVFVTGGAGTGKSFLLRKIISALPRSTTFVTATTGIAALNLGGTTLHSFAGCGLVNRGADRREVFNRVRARSRVKKNWQNCHVLVIDEVSMLDPWFLDVLDYIARRIRNRPDESFGGIQLVLSGDFLQLPPVIKAGRVPSRRQGGPAEHTHNQCFCFESESWLNANPAICLLTKAFRQRDAKFFQMLSEMRMGVVSSMTLARLQALNSATTVNFVARVEGNRGTPDGRLSGGVVGKGERVELANEDGTLQSSLFDGYTILRAKRDEVDRENNFYYAQLTTEEVMYQGVHTGQGCFDEKALPKLVRVRQGCRVMLIKNFDATLGLVNGSTGTVTGFIDASKGYRCRNESITVYDIKSIGIGRGKDDNQKHMLLPVVAFEVRQRDGTMRSREVVVEPQEWKEMQGDTTLSRSVQMPLILAYAITIHKSQGMSLTHVDIDFRNVFETGQSYVALSRCTDLEHTRLHAFAALAVQPNPIALSYYKALEHFLAARQWRRQHTGPFAGAENSHDDDNYSPAGPRDGSRERRAEPVEDDDAPTSFTPYGYVTPSGWGQAGPTGGDHENATSSVVLTPVQSPTMQVEALRTRILPAIEQADRVQQIVRKQSVNASWVRKGRLIMDTTAFFDLITGANSAAQYQMIFETHENCMRVPRTVMEKLSEVAAYKLSQCAEASQDQVQGEAASRSEATPTVTGNTEDSDPESDELLLASNVAAEALELIERAKADFSLDVQRVGESVPLPPCQPSWLQFADALPLLRPPGTRGHTGENLDELNFLLNRDPREVPQHAEILRYALFLRNSFGSQNFVLCTNSTTLAAYGLAYDFTVAHITPDA